MVKPNENRLVQTAKATREARFQTLKLPLSHLNNFISTHLTFPRNFLFSRREFFFVSTTLDTGSYIVPKTIILPQNRFTKYQRAFGRWIHRIYRVNPRRILACILGIDAVVLCRYTYRNILYKCYLHSVRGAQFYSNLVNL